MPRKTDVRTRPNIICVDLSRGKEATPVVVVNEVDRELPPGLDPEQDKKYLINDKSQ